jgi:hypothetical protein
MDSRGYLLSVEVVSVESVFAHFLSYRSILVFARDLFAEAHLADYLLRLIPEVLATA